MPQKTIAVVNSTGRQAASLIRVASAVGYQVHAQFHSSRNLARQDATNLEEISDLESVTLFEGPLEDKNLLRSLFNGAQLAFINTTSWGDEVAIGRSIADAAKRAGTIQHYIYSSMPDHSIYGRGWPGLPNWSSKFTVENYIRQLGLPSTFVYCGIYNNNFTSLPYPLFQMEPRSAERRGGFQWTAPFDPDIPLPWLDAEHDVGPAVLQLFKDGVSRWGGHRIALAFELLTPRQVCAAFSRGLHLPVVFRQGPISIRVPIPAGYKAELDGIQLLFGQMKAPYFGPELSGETHHGPDAPTTTRQYHHRARRGSRQSRRSDESERDALRGDVDDEGGGKIVEEARSLWQGWRGIEEYAREVFPVEEEANGMRWMLESPY